MASNANGADAGYSRRRESGRLHTISRNHIKSTTFLVGGGWEWPEVRRFSWCNLLTFQAFKTSGGSAADEADGEELHAEDSDHSVQEDATTVRYRHIRLPHHDEFLRSGSGARLHPKTRARRRTGNNAQKRHFRRWTNRWRWHPRPLHLPVLEFSQEQSGAVHVLVPEHRAARGGRRPAQRSRQPNGRLHGQRFRHREVC